MSRNGDSQGQELIESSPSTPSKLSWQWQKRASLRAIENSISDVKDKLSNIQMEVETSRKEDKREIKLLLDDLVVSRAKSTRLEKVIEEMKKEKLNILKVNEELLHKKEEELRENTKTYQDSLCRKDEDMTNLKKEWKNSENRLKSEHDTELKNRDAHLAQLEVQHTQKIASLIGDKEKMKNEYELKLKNKNEEMAQLVAKHQRELEETLQAKESAVNELSDKIAELNLKVSEATLYLKNSLQLIEMKNVFISKQRQGFEKIIDHVGECEPKPMKLKGNLWKIAHYVRTGGNAAWKGYINRAQWEAAVDDADNIAKVCARALADYKFETEGEPAFRQALSELFTQLEQE